MEWTWEAGTASASHRLPASNFTMRESCRRSWHPSSWPGTRGAEGGPGRSWRPHGPGGQPQPALRAGRSCQCERQWRLVPGTDLRAPRRWLPLCFRLPTFRQKVSCGPSHRELCMKGNAGRWNSSSAELPLLIHPRAPRCAAPVSFFKSSVEWTSFTIIIATSIHPPFF